MAETRKNAQRSRPKSEGRESRPKSEGRESRPKDEGRESRPKSEGRESRPKEESRRSRPNDDGRRWRLVDADGKVLGRLATQIAVILRGKDKPTFVPHGDVGDFVVVINAEKVRLTGRKLQQKIRYRHSGYPGGLREIPYERLMQTHPERAIQAAVRGMLPKNPLGRKLISKLKVYRGPEHPHRAQRPAQVEARTG